MGDFETISLPKKLMEHINDLRKLEYIQIRYSFASKTEFIRRAISDYIKKIENEIPESVKKRELLIES